MLPTYNSKLSEQVAVLFGRTRELNQSMKRVLLLMASVRAVSGKESPKDHCGLNVSQSVGARL